MSTPQQLAANRSNAQLSTGPRTQEGKAASSRNAITTGLTGRTVLLASDDLDEYTHHLSQYAAEYLPVNDTETELVQSIADCEWRLRRVLTIEAGIFALGELEFAEAYPDEPRALRSALIKTQTHLKYQKQLSNLSIQEARLLRQKAKCIAEFQVLKNNRPKPAVPASAPKTAASAPKIGFEYSDTTVSTPAAELTVPVHSASNAPTPA